MIGGHCGQRQANRRPIGGQLGRHPRSDSEVPLRTMGNLSLARQLTSAALVDRLRLMIFPLIAGEAGRGAFFADDVR
jgi:RibD C-terminal domain